MKIQRMFIFLPIFLLTCVWSNVSMCMKKETEMNYSSEDLNEAFEGGVYVRGEKVYRYSMYGENKDKDNPPIGRIITINKCFPNPDKYLWIYFTSSHGLNKYFCSNTLKLITDQATIKSLKWQVLWEESFNKHVKWDDTWPDQWEKFQRAAKKI